MRIGIIGAQGKLGKKLEKRLLEIAPVDVEIIGTKTREDSLGIAKNSNVLILTIPPSQLTELFKVINSYLSSDVIIISFLAHTNISEIEKVSSRKVVRAMTDPWFNFSAFINSEDVSGLDFLFNNLSKTKPLNLKTDQEIDLFTIYFCYLFVVLLLNAKKTLSDIDPHLVMICDFLNIEKHFVHQYKPDGDPDELISLLATKGGITEMIHSLLTTNPHISPIELIEKVSGKFI